eukprot:Skav212334  [mRNA]  locus=scaffold5228:693:3725:+ [translate_table: standard]
MSDKKKPEYRLTVERISQIIGRDNFTEKGASINEMAKVFKEFGIQARIFNFFNQMILKYDPPKRNHNIKTFYAMVKNFHIYTLNHDLKSIQQKQNLDKPIVKASTDFYINNKENPTYYKMIENVNDIIKLELDDDVKEVYLVMKDNDLTKALFDLTRNGYEPNIQHQINGITSIKMKFNNIKYTIKTQNLLVDSCDGCITVGTEQIYNNMQFAFFHLNKVILNPSHKSYYSDIDLKILNESRTVVPCGLLTWDGEKVPKDIAELDLSKAFTSKFIEIMKIAIFTQFDVWRKFDDTTMDIQQMPDLTMLYVEVPDTGLTPYRTKLLLNKKYSIIYVGVLKELLKEWKIVKLNIIHYKLPSKTEDVDYKGAIDKLQKVRISDDPTEDKNLKKLIANVAIGLLEKGSATDKKSFLFKNIAEALDCQSDYGGKLHKITEQEMVEDDEGDIYEGDETRNHYILNIKDTAELVNGFKYIKELLLQQHNLTMHQAFRKLQKNGINVYSVKTDAFVIDSKNVEKAKTLLNFHNDIGGWRVSKYGDDIILPLQKYEVVRNELINIPTLECKELLIKDEYNTDNIIDEHIIPNRVVLILGEVPGTGKSYICQRMVERGFNVIVICPTNKLLQSFEGEATTMNKFFGINFGNVKLDEFDYSPYDCIVFDEVYFSNASTYWKIKQLVEKNTGKIIIGTGDAMQLKPLQEITNTKDYHKYANEILENIFPYKINLKICKRLTTEEDRIKIYNIKDDIFNNRLSTKQIIEKYFEYTTDISTSKNNIAYLNNTCHNVASEIRKLENRKGEYEVGEFLVCREYTKVKNLVFNVNFEYEIVGINNGIFDLQDVKTKVVQPLFIQKVRENFIFRHCFTCHSAQGSSIDGNVTIFDWNFYLVRNYPEWLWTAITRARDLSKVKFFKYSDDKEDAFNKRCIESYFCRKVENYKLQDKKANREIPKNGYMNAEWFIKNINNQCNYCGCGFTLNINKGNVSTNLTAQRKDNDLTHTLDNIIPFCDRCNRSCK